MIGSMSCNAKLDQRLKPPIMGKLLATAQTTLT
jgi:hypothetical protein